MVQIFLSRKLNALAHTIHANIHTDINIIYASPPPPHTHTHIMVRLDLWKCLLEKEGFDLGLEVREGGEIRQAGRQRSPDSWGNETERTVANRFEIALGFSRVLHLMIRGCLKSETCSYLYMNKCESHIWQAAAALCL